MNIGNKYETPKTGDYAHLVDILNERIVNVSNSPLRAEDEANIATSEEEREGMRVIITKSTFTKFGKRHVISLEGYE